MAKKKQAFEAVKRSVAEARTQGVEIVRRPLFDWTGPSITKPKACDATGAVLLQMGLGASVVTYGGRVMTYGEGEPRPKEWPLLVQKHLGVGAFWLWSFWMGWAYDNQIQVAVTNDNGDIVRWKDEEVCREARTLARKMAKWSSF